VRDDEKERLGTGQHRQDGLWPEEVPTYQQALNAYLVQPGAASCARETPPS